MVSSQPKRTIRSVILVQSLVLGFAALLLTRYPLTQVINYPFNLMFGIASYGVSLVGVLVALYYLPCEAFSASRKYWVVWCSQYSILAVPLLVALISHHTTQNCSLVAGLSWFSLGPIVTITFAVASVLWAYAPQRSWLRTLGLCLLPLLAFTIITAIDLTTGPSVAFSHPALGFFAGPIYDELVIMSPGVWTHQVWVLLFSISLIVSRCLFPRTLHCSSQQYLCALLWLVVIHLILRILLLSEGAINRNLNWHSDFAAVSRSLPSELQSQSLVLHFDRSDLTLTKATQLFHHLHFQLFDLAQQLEINHPTQTVHVYIYPSATLKKQLTGTHYTLLANPLQRRIHLLALEPTHPLLRHELTHIQAQALGWLGLSPRVALMEGLATAMEGRREKLSVHEWSAAMHRLNLLPDMQVLLSTLGFWQQAPARAYLSAGSWVRWLIDQHGMTAFKKAYRSGSFDKAYGQSLPSLIQDWHNYISEYPLSDKDLESTKTRLTYRSIIERQCPFDVARYQHQASQCPQQINQPLCRTTLLHKANQASGNSIPTLLALMREQAHNQELSNLLLSYQSLLKHTDLLPSHHYLATLLRADALVITGHLSQAMRFYRSVDNQHLSLTQQLQLIARIVVLKHAPQHIQPFIHHGISRELWTELQSKSLSLNEEPAYLWWADQAYQKNDIDLTYDLVTTFNQTPSSKEPYWLEQHTILKAMLAEARQQPDQAAHQFANLAHSAATHGISIFANEQMRRLRYAAQNQLAKNEKTTY